MKCLRISILALLALLALSANMVSPSSAEQGFLPLSTKGVQFLAIGEFVWETHNKESTKCTKTSGTGTFTSDSKATGTLTFEGCTSLGFSSLSLTSTTAGQVKENVSLAICLINSAELKFGIAITPTETAHVEVPAVGVLFELKGTIIGEIATKKGKLFSITFGGKEGLGNVPECKAGTETIKSSLLSRKDPEAFGELSWSIKLLVQFGEEVELMDADTSRWPHDLSRSAAGGGPRTSAGIAARLEHALSRQARTFAGARITQPVCPRAIHGAGACSHP